MHTSLIHRYRQCSGHGAQTSLVRVGLRLTLPDVPSAGTLPSGMTTLRQYVDELSAQLKLARAKQETDAKAVKDLQEENLRLKQLVESASEVRIFRLSATP